MNNFPVIPNLEWLNDEYPDIVSIKINLERLDPLGISDPIQVPALQYLDMTALIGVRRWHAKNEDRPSKTECIADFNGVDQLVLNITKEDLIKAWLFTKNYERVLINT
jgi:hypothetical protein